MAKKARVEVPKTFEGHVSVCCHDVEFYYDIEDLELTDELEERLTEEAEERAKYCINDGCSPGELVCFFVDEREREYELTGWFSIVRD